MADEGKIVDLYDPENASLRRELFLRDRALNMEAGTVADDEARWAANYLAKSMTGIDTVDGAVFNDMNPMAPRDFLVKMQDAARARSLDSLKSDWLRKLESIPQDAPDAFDQKLALAEEYAKQNEHSPVNNALGTAASRLVTDGYVTKDEMGYLDDSEREEAERLNSAMESRPSDDLTSTALVSAMAARPYDDFNPMSLDGAMAPEEPVVYAAAAKAHAEKEAERKRIEAERKRIEDESMPRIRELKGLAEKRRKVAAFENRVAEENAWITVAHAKQALGEKAQWILDTAEAHKDDMETAVGGAFAKLAREDPAEARRLAPVLQALHFNPAGNTVAGDAWRAFVRTGTDTALGAVEALVNTFERGVVNGAEYQARREREALFRRAFAEKQKDHDWWGDAAVGFFGTLPYMGIAAIPYAGTATIAMAAANDFEQQVADAGGDVSDPEFFIAKFAVGATYAAIERAQVIHPLRKLGDFSTARAYAEMFSSVSAFLKTAAHQGHRLGSEVWEEGLQGALERGFVAYGCERDVASAAAQGLVQDMHGSIGAFMPLMVLEGAGTRRFYRHGGLTGADIVAANETIKGFADRTEKLTAEDAKHFGEAYGAIAVAWANAGPDSVRRMDTLHKRFGLTGEEAAMADSTLERLWEAVSETRDEEAVREFFGGARLRSAAEMLKETLRDATVADNADGTQTISGFIGESGHEVSFTIIGRQNLAIDVTSRTQAPSIVNALNQLGYEDGKLTEKGWFAKTVEERLDVAAHYGLGNQGYVDNRKITVKTSRTLEDGTEEVVEKTLDGKALRILSGDIVLDENTLPQTVFHEAMHGLLKLAEDIAPKELMDALKEAYPPLKADEAVNEERIADLYRDYLSGKIPAVEYEKGLFDRLAAWIRGLLGMSDAALTIADARTSADVLFNQMLSGNFSGVVEADEMLDVQLARLERQETEREAEPERKSESKETESAKAETKADAGTENLGKEKFGGEVVAAEEADGRSSVTGRATSADTDGATAEDIAEAARQYAEVEARYTNPDGTRKPGWMTAPNGKPTKLTERQWVQVRTENFKRWFGDWEYAAILSALENSPFADVVVGAFQKGENLSVQRTAALLFPNAETYDTPMGAVVIDARSAKNTLGHGYGQKKLDALVTLQRDFRNAVYIGSQRDFDGKDIVNHYFAYRINYGGERNFVFCRAREDMNANRLYLHEVILEDEIKQTGDALQTAAASSQGDASHTDASSVARLNGTSLAKSILQRIYDVKPENVSKVVDENGEPMVVYHRSADEFDAFDPAKIHADMDVPGFYFADYQGYEDLRERPYETAAFLNIRDPYIAEYGKAFDRYTPKAWGGEGVDLREDGYDGAIRGREYIATDPAQIKSATDNVGTFSQATGDMRWSISLGAPYQGSKGRIATRIVDALPDGRRFVDLFSGGGSVTHAAMLSGKYSAYRMNDLDGVGQRLFLQGLRGEWDNYSREVMSEDEFDALRGTPEALAWSFNGLGRNLAKVGPDGRNRAQEQIRRVQELSALKDQSDRTEATEEDYRDVELREGDVVYADIPYEGTDTRGYGKGGQFDKSAFVAWAQQQDVPVFVSEYTMPAGWTEVAAFPATGMRGAATSEKLWVQDKFADSAASVTKADLDAVAEVSASPDALVAATEGATVVSTPGARYSIRSMLFDLYHSSMLEDLVAKGIFTKRQASGFRRDVERLIDFIVPNALILDLNEEFGKDERVFTPFKPNSDKLYKISLDFSTLCKKRLFTQSVIERLQIMRGSPLSAVEQLKVRQLLLDYAKIEKGLQVACHICYVEAARLKSPNQIARFLEDPAAVVADYFAKKNSDFLRDAVAKKQAEYKQELGISPDATKDDIRKEFGQKAVDRLEEITRAARRDYKPSDTESAIIDRARNLKAESFLSAAALAELARTEPEIFAAYSEFIRNATHSKGLEADVPYYYGDSSALTDKFIQKMNEQGTGLRHQSWSDFQLRHLLDTITAICDLAVRGAKMHTYTKVPAMARILGKTGVMINLSLMPSADGSGFSSTEGMDIDEAMALRELFPETCGTIAVAMSDANLISLLNDDRIDYVVPYHVSGLNKNLRNIVGVDKWKDYTRFQNESAERGSARPESIPAEDWHRHPEIGEWLTPSKDGYAAMRKGVDRYLQLCTERGLVPKFAGVKGLLERTPGGWKVLNGNYWKLLIDHKMVNHKTGRLIEQQAVRPNFDFAQIKREIDAEVSSFRDGASERAFDYVTAHANEAGIRIDQESEDGQRRHSVAGTASPAENVASAKTEAQRALDLIGGTELGNAINRDFKEEGQTTIIGRTVRTAGDLASAAQICRNPAFETMRYFFTKDGKVVWQTSITARKPSAAPTYVRDAEGDNDTFAQFSRMAAALKPDGIWMLHNHPSGDVTPSRQDVAHTRRFAQQHEDAPVTFKGHVIIDHNKYAFIPADNGSTKTRKRDFSRDEASFHGAATDNLSVENPAPGSLVAKPEDAMEIARTAIRGQNAAAIPGAALTLIATDAKRNVRSVATIPTAEMLGLLSEGVLQDYAAATGGSSLILVGDTELRNYPQEVQKRLLGMCATGTVLDFIYEKGADDIGSAFRERLVHLEPPGPTIARRVAESSGPRFSVVSDTATVSRLEKEVEDGDYYVTYRAVERVTMPDGTEALVPPMNGYDPETRQYIDPAHEGDWLKADIDEAGIIDDGTGDYAHYKISYRVQNQKTGKWKRQDTIVALNPYIHTSFNPFNDQFSAAYNRPNLVVVRMLVPKSAASGEKAHPRAKDAPGFAQWKAGGVASQLKALGKPERKVLLSNYAKIDKVLSYAEVADLFDEMADGVKDKLSIPANVMPPALRDEMESRGYRIVSQDRFSVTSLMAGGDATRDLAEAAEPTVEDIARKLEVVLVPDDARHSITSSLRTGVDSTTEYVDSHGVKRTLYVVEGDRKHGWRKIAYRHCVDFGTAFSGGFTLDELERCEKLILTDGVKSYGKTTGRRTFKWKSPEGVTFTIGTYKEGKGKNAREVVNTVYTDRTPRQTKKLGANVHGQAHNGQPSKNIVPQSGAKNKQIPQSAADILPEAPRESVTGRAPNGKYGRNDYVVAMAAQDKLRGIDRPPQKYAELAKALGATRFKNDDGTAWVRLADKLIEKNRDKLSRLAERDIRKAVRETARMKAEADFSEHVQKLFTNSARFGEEIGSAATSAWLKIMRDLAARAKGYDLDAMRRDTGADLLLTLMDIMPEKFAPSEDEGKGKGEGEATEEEGEAGQDGELVGPPTPQTWEEWQKNAEERRKHYNAVILLAKEWIKKRQAEIQARENARAKREAEEEAKRKSEAEGAESAGAEADVGTDEEGAEPEEDSGPLAIPREIIEAAEVDLQNADEFAAFMRAWICDWLVRQNPGTTYANVLDDEARLATYRRTMIAQLRDIAESLLDPTEGKAAIMAERMIADIRENASANELERRTSDILGFIQRNAIRQKRKGLIADLLKMIEAQAIRGRKFDALERDMRRKIRGDHEQYCRYIARVIQMSDNAVAKETEALMQIIEGRKDDYEQAAAEYGVELNFQSDVEVHRAYEKLAALQQFGGLKNKMPSYIVAASKRLEEWLGSERMEHERRWGEFQAVCDDVAQVIEAGVKARRDKYAKEEPGLGGRMWQDVEASVRQRLEEMLVGAGPARVEAIAKVMLLLSEGSQTLEVTKMEYRRQFEKMMKAAVEGTDIDEKGLLTLLDEEIPEDLNDLLDADLYDADGNLVHERQRVRMTWGQAIQLYSSLLQTATYGANIALHGRQDHAKAIEQAAHPALIRLAGLMRGIYQERREALSGVVAQVTGLGIFNPDPMYMPAKMNTGMREGLDQKTYAWSPLAKSLTPRVKNRLDFDLSASVMDVFRQRSDESARAIAFGVRGMALRSMLARKSVVEAMARTHGILPTRRLIEQVTDTLMGGYTLDAARGGIWGLVQKSGTFTTYAALSYNLVTALKQMQSVSAWAPLLQGGYLEIGRHIVNFDMEAARELCQAPGFVARYGETSFGRMLQTALADKEGGLVSRLARAGMTIIQIGDFVPGILVGQGVYKARVDALLRQNPNADVAAIKAQASTETWALIEECQQTGRLEDTPHMLRRWGVMGRQVTKFATAPIQQVAHELHTWRMWHEAARLGDMETAKEFRRKFINTMISNHVILPAAFYAVATLFGMALGDEPPEEDELFGDLLLQMLVGPFARIFFAGTIINGLVAGGLRLTGLKPNVYPESAFPAAQTIDRIVKKGFMTASDIANADAQTVADDLLDEVGIVNAPVRYATKAVRNYSGYDSKKHRREAIKARKTED